MIDQQLLSPSPSVRYNGVPLESQYSRFDILISINVALDERPFLKCSKTPEGNPDGGFLNREPLLRVDFDLKSGTEIDEEDYGFHGAGAGGSVTGTYHNGSSVVFQVDANSENGEPEITMTLNGDVGFTKEQYSPDSRVQDLIGLIRSLRQNSTPPVPRIVSEDFKTV